jgi:K(+)-stimulated pyrophosphate-energized sodium pump
MKQISRYIAEGAMAFLKAEWKILGYFVVIGFAPGFMAKVQIPPALVHFNCVLF